MGREEVEQVMGANHCKARCSAWETMPGSGRGMWGEMGIETSEDSRCQRELCLKFLVRPKHLPDPATPRQQLAMSPDAKEAQRSTGKMQTQR